MSSDALLTATGLTAGYGPIQVLQGIDFHVGSGEIVVILGANGAGKTTTMRALSGMIARRGSVVFDGTEMAHAKPDAVVRSGISQVPQGRGTFTDLSVEDNLMTGAYSRKGDVSEDLERWFEAFPRLRERREQVSSQRGTSAWRSSGSSQQPARR